MIPLAATRVPSPQSFASPGTNSSPLDPTADLAASGTVNKIHAGPQTTETESLLNKIGEPDTVSYKRFCLLTSDRITDDMTTTDQDTNGLVLTMVQPVKELLESSDTMKAIEKGVNAFMEDIPWLMKGLDEIARIHPVVTGTFRSSFGSRMLSERFKQLPSLRSRPSTRWR